MVALIILQNLINLTETCGRVRCTHHGFWGAYDMEPNTLTSPSVRRISPMIADSKLVLPAPTRPSTPTSSPFRTVKLILQRRPNVNAINQQGETSLDIIIDPIKHASILQDRVISAVKHHEVSLFKYFSELTELYCRQGYTKNFLCTIEDPYGYQLYPYWPPILASEPIQ